MLQQGQTVKLENDATLTCIKKAEKPGEYKRTIIDDQKDKADIRIIACGGGFTIAVKPHVEIKGRGVRRKLNNGVYEVTDNKLSSLREKYNVVTDF